MANLRLSLFGPGVLALDGRIVRAHSTKALALLAYLAVESDRPHSRDRLASLLWGKGSDASARQSLRQALYSLKRAGDGRLESSLDSDHELVRFSTDRSVEVDVHRFLAGVRATDPSQWRAAAGAYRAPLLDGRVFDDCDEFMAWLHATRERLHALAARNYERMAVERMASADWDAALQHAQAWRDLEPASEAPSRQLIRIHAARHEPHAIHAEWTRLCAVLERELDARPARETAELYQALGPAAASAGLPDAGEAESLVRAARAAERVYAFGNAVELYDRRLQALKSASPAALARRCEVLLHKEAVLERLGRRAEQAAAVGEALRIAESLGDNARLASVLLRQAGACAYIGRNAEAVHAAQRALEIYRCVPDRPGEAEALRELGFVHWRAENYASALDFAREALALHRRLGDVAGEASALHNLAEIHRGLGSPRQALEWYQQALQLHWSAQNHAGEILTLFGVANALQQAGDPSGSKEKYESALALSERYGERTMQARALHALAMQCAEAADSEAALRLMQRAVEIDRAIGYAHALGHDLLDLSHIHWLRGERIEAHAALQEALVWFRYTEDHEALASAGARLRGMESGDSVAAVPRQWIKSHLPLGEGKVYCEFESPLGRMRLPE